MDEYPLKPPVIVVNIDDLRVKDHPLDKKSKSNLD